ncbi:MAG: YbhB/YbcL family Raf kinase inhibitor-like protein [Gammaproteobacteria bacterium]|nr:YbhB/YbcL family Raf kinase inhibitor-like protein [Gammaproteobacteria bacterium]MCP5199176.1 YbhB/YbcL family Raf kinase inhibitor-like protein [Gammaproteobacteria bacterium]
MALILTSESFKEGELLGTDHVLSEAFGFGCAGGNLSPQLAWQGAPDGTQSFAVTCFDPDAPTGSGFWHWVVANIPAEVSGLPLGAGDPARGAMPAGALEVRTDFGKPGYGGPCPPEGANIHRYIFTVYAVGVKELPVTADTSAAVVGFYLNFNTLEKASLIGLYRR